MSSTVDNRQVGPGLDLMMWLWESAEVIAAQLPNPPRRNRAYRRAERFARRRALKQVVEIGSYDMDGQEVLLLPEALITMTKVPAPAKGTPTSVKGALGRRIRRVTRHAARRGRTRGPNEGDGDGDHHHHVERAGVVA